MSPWVKLNVLSLLPALPLAALYIRFSSRPAFVAMTKRVEALFEKPWIFPACLIFLGALYFHSRRGMVTFDEYGYASAARQGVFCGANHFLTHFLGYWTYLPMRPWVSSLAWLQFINIVTCLVMIVLVRAILLQGNAGRAMATAGALALGTSYGIWKYASSAEVYPLMLTLWVACLWQGQRVFQGRDSWGQFMVLSVLSNAAVLAHDMAALMAPAFCVALLMGAGKKRWIYLFRYVVTGLALFPFFQAFATLYAGITSLSGYVNHHMYYSINPDAKPGDYHYTVARNFLLTIREGLFSMFTGVDSAWGQYPVCGKVATVVAHTGAAAFLFALYGLGFRGLWQKYRQDKSLPFGFWVAISTWVSIYGFAIFWRPNDEVSHWFLPFTVLAVGAGLACLALMERSKVVVALAALAFFNVIAASGLYDARSSKLLTGARASADWLVNVEDSALTVFNNFETTQSVMSYYRPKVSIATSPEGMAAIIDKGGTAYVDVNDKLFMDYFSQSPYRVESWKDNPFYVRVYKEAEPRR